MDFPANSQKSKATDPPRNIERVTSAETVRRKRGIGHKFKDVFIGGDSRSAADHVIFGVFVPTLRDMLFDGFETYVRSMIYGDNKPRRGLGSMPTQGMGHVPYNRMSTPSPMRTTQQPRTLSRQSRTRHDFDDLVIPSRQEAEEVLSRMYDILGSYGTVSVADLYELTGVQSSHTDMRWGWTNLGTPKAVKLRQGGFLLDLPRPEPLG